MKCPKCGFNSFEYYDSCKKCSCDLNGYKLTYSITSMVLPHEAKVKLAAEFRSAESAAEQISDSAETRNDIFSFNLPDDSPAATAQGNESPFDFDKPSPNVIQTGRSKPEEDVFADLLESTSQTETSPFEAVQTTFPPATTKSADISSGPGEFDLENFSWDDPPAATDGTESTDDFDSLFGDTKKDTQK